MRKERTIRRRLLSILLALAMAAGLMPAMALPAHAKATQETWTTSQIIESDKTIDGGVYAGLEVSVTISKGATLTINNGISMQEGAELIVYGEGTLIVNGYNGQNGREAFAGNQEFVGGNGEDGGSAINGDIVVAGGEVWVTGGRGGNGGYGEDKGGNGGNGGYGVEGNVTVSGGSITVTGGSGGSGGTTSPEGEAGSNGSNTRAVSGDISREEGAVVVGQESEDGSSWNYIRGEASECQYVYLEAATLYPLWVNDTRVTSANANDVLYNGTVSFTPAEGETPATLTLDGASITNEYIYDEDTSASAGIYYTGTDTLNIVLPSGSESTIEIGTDNFRGKNGIRASSGISFSG